MAKGRTTLALSPRSSRPTAWCRLWQQQVAEGWPSLVLFLLRYFCMHCCIDCLVHAFGWTQMYTPHACPSRPLTFPSGGGGVFWCHRVICLLLPPRERLVVVPARLEEHNTSSNAIHCRTTLSTPSTACHPTWGRTPTTYGKGWAHVTPHLIYHMIGAQAVAVALLLDAASPLVTINGLLGVAARVPQAPQHSSTAAASTAAPLLGCRSPHSSS